jgi:hypothetical protein
MAEHGTVCICADLALMVAFNKLGSLMRHNALRGVGPLPPLVRQYSTLLGSCPPSFSLVVSFRYLPLSVHLKR